MSIARRPGILVAVAFLAAISCLVDAQRNETIPEKVARGVYGRVFNVPSGKSPTVSELLAITDIVVRAQVGAPRSYMSEDQTLVYTDYPLLSPILLYASAPATAVKPGATPALTVTQRGGSATVGEFTYKQSEATLAPFVPGTEYLFLLERRGEKYFPVQTYFGAFRISDGQIIPLVNKRFAPEYRGQLATEVMEDLVKHLKHLRR